MCVIYLLGIDNLVWWEFSFDFFWLGIWVGVVCSCSFWFVNYRKVVWDEGLCLLRDYFMSNLVDFWGKRSKIWGWYCCLYVLYGNILGGI